ncbi:response regulator transcription factor [Nocardioides panacisoli]|uniref:LuxR C-terminal-related transcriptional regulator n=1 Tax=Nocardioides panacisoli TaxID=627624 RepID=UPI001C634EEB|nr:response regulator transcription factor [Nocardioides panacisoli]QYJ04207.1 response regulator transcription factor [Nocardioides panacisoli]
MGRHTGSRITIVEDHVLFAETLAVALQVEGHEVRRIALEGEHRDVSSLLPLVLRTRPTMVLLDLDLGSHGNGMRLVEPLVAEGITVIIMTGSGEPARWGESVALGARKVMSKATPLNDVLATIRRINEGLPVTTVEERGQMVRAWHRERHEVRDARSRMERLTRRESEVLAHLIEGRQVREIARHSVVSEATVRTQVKSILAKLEVSSQVAAVGVARRAGWVATPH